MEAALGALPGRSALFLLLLTACALAGSSAAQSKREELQALPGCAAADFGPLTAAVEREGTACRAWFMYGATTAACPVQCRLAFPAVGQDCFVSWGVLTLNATYGLFDSQPSEEEVASYMRAMYVACQKGTALPLGAEAALWSSVLQPVPACSGVNATAAAATGCSSSALVESTVMATIAGFCSPACATFLKELGAGCFAAATIDPPSGPSGGDMQFDPLGIYDTCIISLRAVEVAKEIAALPSCSRASQQKALRGYDSYCKDWLSISATVESCPEECASALQDAGVECFAAYYRLRKGLEGSALGDEALLAFTNATFAACQASSPLPEEDAAAMLEELLASFPSCSAANLSAILTAGCDLNKAAGFLRSATCSTECGLFVQAVGRECFLEMALAKAHGNGLLPGPDTARSAAQASALFDRCMAAAASGQESRSP